MKVFKYLIPLETTFKILLPIGAKILDIRAQGDEVYLCCLIDPANKEKIRYFNFVMTGESFSYHRDLMEYIGTVHFISSGFVMHLFEDLQF